MASEETASYVGFLEQDETLDDTVVEFLKMLEGRGWRASTRRDRGFRYHCPCATQHNIWVEASRIVPERIEFFARRTCLPVLPSTSN